MLPRSIFPIAICVLVAAWWVSSLGGLSVAAPALAKVADKPKRDKSRNEVPETADARAAVTKREGGKEAATGEDAEDDPKPVHKTDREWKRLLSAKEYRVTRQKETEQPFTGKYVHTKKEGVYRCVCCGAKLFGSDTKFDSGTGWPSFYAPLTEKGIASAADYSDGTPRVEVTCSRCDAHLGHVFGDGPEPTGLRYCINSVALKLEEPSKPGGRGTSGAKSDTKPSGKKPNRQK